MLTDGTVLLHEEQDSSPQKWYKLTPDNTGSYINGTIKEIASLPVINGVQYGPFYFGSVVLTGGRYIMEGGEYNNGQAVWTNLGAIYDPNDNKWTAVNPPAGWSLIGDAQSVILNNGTYMQAELLRRSRPSLLQPQDIVLDEHHEHRQSRPVRRGRMDAATKRARSDRRRN